MTELIDSPQEQARSGRPPKYSQAYAKQAEKLCQLGATDEDLADFFGVSIRTIERWRVEYVGFCRAVKNGKDAADDAVERSLFKRAMGYTFDSEKIFHHEGKIVRAQTREHVPPDTASIIFWLKNRRKDVWRDKQDIDHTHVHTISQAFEDHLKALQTTRGQALEIEYAPVALQAAE